MRQYDPKGYWKLINGEKKNVSRNDVHIDELYEYFKAMNTADDTHDESEVPGDVHNDEINRPITVNEIRDVIKNLQKNKSGSCDQILNEHIIHTSDIFLSIYCEIFNCILDTGIYPDQWAKGMIIPIYKNKGDKKNHAITDQLHL